MNRRPETEFEVDARLTARSLWKQNRNEDAALLASCVLIYQKLNNLLPNEFQQEILKYTAYLKLSHLLAVTKAALEPDDRDWLEVYILQEELEELQCLPQERC